MRLAFKKYLTSRLPSTLIRRSSHVGCTIIRSPPVDGRSPSQSLLLRWLSRVPSWLLPRFSLRLHSCRPSTSRCTGGTRATARRRRAAQSSSLASSTTGHFPRIDAMLVLSALLSLLSSTLGLVAGVGGIAGCATLWLSFHAVSNMSGDAFRP